MNAILKLHRRLHIVSHSCHYSRDGFEASMLEAKAKARPCRGQAKAKSAKTCDYRVLERELKAKAVFLMPWKFTLHNFGQSN